MISPASAGPLLAASMTPYSGASADSVLADIHVTAAKGKMSVGEVDKVANEFESMFVSQMLEQMFGESIGAAAFGDGETSDIYKGLMMDAYGKEIARSGGIGIANYVKQELLKLQEV